MTPGSKPLNWSPRGVSDTLDSTASFSGAMSQLQNLVPDPTTKALWQCRPAAIESTSFAGFATPGFISAFKIVGSFAYGMIASARNANHDEPFVYNLLTNAFVAVSGVTLANTPVSPLTTGTWVPPTMALIGAKMIVTHPGFTGAAGAYVGVLNISVPAAPAWSAVNLTGAVTFTVPPSAVAQFNGRAYYVHNLPAQPAVIFSDSLNPTVVTAATQILTFGDNVALTGFGPLPLNNQLGGVVQALMVFKGVQNIFQILGDAATNNLSVNSLNITTGTLAVNTIVTTPKGLSFVSPDGVRVIDFNGHVGDPIGMDGMGVAVPFIYSVVPSRMAAACEGNILRISVQNGATPGSPNQEFWYDFARGIWSGPHTFPVSLIQPYINTFVVAPTGLPGSLWRSDPVQSVTSTFVENGAQLVWNYVTALLPNTEQMTQNAMTETLLDMALSAIIPNINVNALDQNGAVLGAVQIASPTGATQWGAFAWGGAVWSGPPNALAPRQLPWTQALVFTRLQIQATGLSAAGLKIGAVRSRYQILRYLTNLDAVA